jgi:hypothetical protein
MGQSCECVPNGDVTAAVTGSLAVGAGKVIFKWMPVKNKPCFEPNTYMPAPPTTLPTILNAEDFAPRSMVPNFPTGFPAFPGTGKADCGCGK